MRVAVCTLAALIGMAQLAYADDADKADKDKKIIEKKIDTPSLDLNGYSPQFNTDLSRQPDSIDPPGTSQFRNDNAHPYFGLKFSEPLK
ncbi:MAG: hypothetical protein P8Y53_15440 [Pseudolabrys sp.]